MITTHFANGKPTSTKLKNFTTLVSSLNHKRADLHNLPLPVIIELLAQAGKTILTDKTLNQIEGVTYISWWLRKDHLEKMYQLNCPPENPHLHLLPQPRGIVCHWIASNIPTLAFFSLVLGILSQNGNILKIPPQNRHLIIHLLDHISKASFTHRQHKYTGKELLTAVALVSFPSEHKELNLNFSQIADCKVIWGGAGAVSSITALPQKEHCEIITLGPKYSFGVFDQAMIESPKFLPLLQKMATDIVLFNQTACSSPQVLFFEPSKYSLTDIGHMLKNCFVNVPPKLLHQPLPISTIAKIITARAQFALDLHKDVIAPTDTSWTILVSNTCSLEEPIHGKTIFIKPVKNILTAIPPLITHKIQAISLGIANPKTRDTFIKQVTYRGVDRIVTPGHIHEFDLPWDGILLLNRLIRWTSVKAVDI